MKAEELRIGNYVNMHGGNDATFWYEGQPRFLAKISSIGASMIGYTNIEKAPNYCHTTYEPIPLTEEILVKCEFERDFKLESLNILGDMKEYKHGDPYTDKFIRICFHDEGGYTVYYHGTPINKPIYLHQLQNLCFALTGEELKMNL